MADGKTVHICIRCEQQFDIGSKEVCPRAPDGGEHETPHAHHFTTGRLDGRCAFKMPTGLDCGYPDYCDWNSLHVG